MNFGEKGGTSSIRKSSCKLDGFCSVCSKPWCDTHNECSSYCILLTAKYHYNQSTKMIGKSSKNVNTVTPCEDIVIRLLVILSEFTEYYSPSIHGPIDTALAKVEEINRAKQRKRKRAFCDSKHEAYGLAFNSQPNRHGSG